MSGAEIRIDGGGVRLGIVVSRFNEPVTSRLLAGAEACLDEAGCGAPNRQVHWVPGAWELPLAAKKLADRGEVDAIVVLGALIRGETPHFDYLGQQVARGLGRIGLDSGIPVIFGVLTTESADQAFARAGGEHSDKGREAALAALEMVQLFRRMEGS